MATELTSTSLPPLSLYVHLPWCVRKCPYCDFNSFTMGNDAPRDRYLDALVSDLAEEAGRSGDRELTSIFLGGGTPSVFSAAQIGRLLSSADGLYRFASDIEITMEANPGTVECGDPAGYRQAGVNRLSIGAQTFSPESLEVLGRIHSVEDISRSVDEARSAGFDNINVDLMYGLPGQDIEAAMFDIERAAKLGPSHLSWYQLTLEPNTVFHARPPEGMPDQEISADIQEAGQELLAGLGYEQYEVSAWARGRSQCRHNLNYWSFGDYVAVGAGAHGKLTNETGVWRFAKPANPNQYMETIESGAEAGPLRAVSDAERLFEYMLNILRLNEGFSADHFTARTGLPAELLRERLGPPVEKGLIIKISGDSWQVTSFGRRFLNDLQAEFLPE